MAISSLRLSPWARPPARVSAWWASPTSLEPLERRARWPRPPGPGSAAGSSAPPSAACAARRTFSSAVSPSKRLEVWNVRPSPARARASTELAGDVLAGEVHACPAVGPHDAGQQVEQRGLAGPVGADHAEHLARRDGEA